jgi:hypothetical protein
MRSRSVAIGMVFAVPAALGLTACHSSSSPSASPSAPTSPVVASTPAGGVNPPVSPPSSTPVAPIAKGRFNSCSVVTQSEAAAALGGPVSKGVLGHATVEGGLACVFYGQLAAKPRVPDLAQLDTVRVVVVEGATAKKWYNDYASKIQPVAVSGLGDEAYYDGNASLSVLSGSTYLRVAVIPVGAPPTLAPEQALAKAIVPTLSRTA